ncbi:hypothetical protein HOE91_03570 [archaeon]|jgi:hypothetical protein|nr:hypothetical protein [Cryomorphaceae bacterium]MBT3985349.1 hypothetical protein [archaeon]
MSKHTRSHKRTRKTKLSHAQIRKQLLSLSFNQIRSKISKIDQDEVEYLNENDIDMEVADDGYIDETDRFGEDLIFNEMTKLDATERKTNFLDLTNNYIITVYSNNHGNYKCYFEPPLWMTNRVSTEYKQVLNGMIRIIQRIADTFEISHQKFLADPIKYFEWNFKKTNQKEFVRKLNESEKILDEGDLSLIKKYVWFVWDDLCLPLSALFMKGE